MKKERIKKRIYRTRAIANAEIADDIERFDTRTRRHRHLSGVCPEAFEAVAKRASRCPEKAGKSSFRSSTIGWVWIIRICLVKFLDSHPEAGA